MTDNGNGQLEILVHISAPSRNEDDAKHRALARSYLQFEPARRLSLHAEPINDFAIVGKGKGKAAEVISTDSPSQSDPPNDRSIRIEEDLGTRSKDAGPTIFRRLALKDVLQGENSRSFNSSRAFISPTVSFSDAINNADSPPLRSKVLHPEQNNAQPVAAEAQDSWETPPSVISDSQPQNNRVDLPSSAPIHVLELYLRDLTSSRENPAHQSKNQNIEACGNTDDDLPRMQKDHGAASQIRIEDPSSEVVLVTPSSTEDVLLLPEVPGQNEQSSSFTYEFVHRRDANITKAQEPPSLRSRPLKRQKTESLPPTSSAPSSIQASRQSVSSQFNFDALEIHPPGPEISSEDLTPDMLVSKSLLKLSERMEMAALFKPKSQLRPLRPMERGYWSVDCHFWDEDLQRRAWKCLHSFIGKGEAGWGVWSVRDAEFGTLRVYCWGAVVGHIYLLLYMASESKIRNTGASWIGGDGSTIIVMAS